MLCLLEGQPPNLLTFSRQIDVKHYVHEKLTFLMVWMWRHLNYQTKKSNAQKYSDALIESSSSCRFTVSQLLRLKMFGNKVAVKRD